MEAALCVVSLGQPFSAYKSIPRFLAPTPKPCLSANSRVSLVKAATVSDDSFTVDYSSLTSVFPAEACETIGGDACSADIYPEVKLKPEASSDLQRTVVSEQVDREYLEYNDAKTVFRGEACDDLGGEFCSSEYQKGVY